MYDLTVLYVLLVYIQAYSATCRSSYYMYTRMLVNYDGTSKEKIKNIRVQWN